jgi:hypothetical protein
MANRKISDLTALTAPATGDLLPIVDISEAAAADKNKKITLGTLLSGAPLGSAAAPSFAFLGDSNTGIYSPGADQVAISTGGTEKLIVKSDGKVGIGNSVPLTSLAVTGGITGGNTAVTGTEVAFPSAQANAYLRLLGNYQVGAGRGGTIQLGGKSFSDSGTISSFLISAESGDNATSALTFSTQTAFNNSIVERMRLTPTGLGIGTTSPSLGLLEVSSTNGVTLAIKNTTGTTSGTEFCQLTFNNTSNSSANFESAKIKAISTNGGANLAHLTFENSGTEKARIDSSGRLLVGGSPDSGGALLQVFGDRIRVGTAKTPASASDTGTAGEICWDASYIYVCTATNTWKRTAIATW